MEQGRDKVKAMLESRRCRGNVEVVECRAWSVVDELRKIAV